MRAADRADLPPDGGYPRLSMQPGIGVLSGASVGQSGLDLP